MNDAAIRAWIETGLRAPAQAEGHFTIRVDLRMGIGLALDPGASLRGDDLVEALCDNIRDFLSRLSDQDTLRLITRLEDISAFGSESTSPAGSLWTPGDSQQANAQGWDILDANGSADGRLQLQRIDESGIFPDDAAAAVFVKAQADAGESLARKAIAFLIAAGSGDVHKFHLASHTVTCKLCGRQADSRTAHLHQDGYVGECCWDERLRGSE